MEKMDVKNMQVWNIVKLMDIIMAQAGNLNGACLKNTLIKKEDLLWSVLNVDVVVDQVVHYHYEIRWYPNNPCWVRESTKALTSN